MMRKLYISAFVLALIIGLIAGLPAAVTLPWLGLPDNIKIHGVQGNLSDGRAQAVDISRLRLNQPQWQLKPVHLLWLHVSHRLNISGPQGPISAHTAVGPLGGLSVSDMTARLSMADIASAMGLPFLAITGDLHINIDDLAFSDNQLQTATGRLDLFRSSWRLSKPNPQLGDFAVDIHTEDERIIADIKDINGPIETQGQAELNNDTGSYSLNLRLRPRARANQNQRNLLLQQLGQPDEAGWHSLKRQGQFRQDPPES